MPSRRAWRPYSYFAPAGFGGRDPELRLPHAATVIDVDLARPEPHLLVLHPEGGFQRVGWRTLIEEDRVSVIGRRLGKGVRREYGSHLRRCPHDDAHALIRIVEESRLEVGLHAHRG